MDASTAGRTVRPTGPVGDGAEDCAWTLVRALARVARQPGFDPERPLRLAVQRDGSLTPVPVLGVPVPDPHWVWTPGSGWSCMRAPGDPSDCALLDLYLPLCGPDSGPDGRRCRAVAHLGQSLDGYIATSSGDSCFVTGPENIRHLHRMRALSDAVLVGTETAACDNPRLTTRLVPGDNPLRIVLDRQRRLPPGLRVFTDGAAETLLVCDAALVAPGRDRQGQARVIGIGTRSGRLDLGALVETLAGQGIRRLFVEGGGATVSAFMAAGLLASLQIAVAPVLIGTGRPGLRLPAPERLADARRPAVRVFRMGADMLYDLDLTGAAAPTRTGTPTGAAGLVQPVIPLSRIA